MGIDTKYTVEKVWHHKGLRCVVLMTNSGHRCGYVGVDKSNAFYGKEYSDTVEMSEENKAKWEAQEFDIDKTSILSAFCHAMSDEENPRADLIFSVHGGLTYSGGGEKSKYPIHSDLWWFGYDCAHSGDGKDMKYLKTHNKSMFEIEEKYMTFDYGTLRSHEYCVEECNSLAGQLAAFTL